MRGRNEEKKSLSVYLSCYEADAHLERPAGVLGHTDLTNLVCSSNDLVLVAQITDIIAWKRPGVLICPRGC
jgi:hypothetical protein